MRKVAGVQQCYDLAAPWDDLVIVVAESMAHCRTVVGQLFLEQGNVARCETLFLFDVVKLGLSVPLRRAR